MSDRFTPVVVRRVVNIARGPSFTRHGYARRKSSGATPKSQTRSSGLRSLGGAKGRTKGGSESKKKKKRETLRSDRQVSPIQLSRGSSVPQTGEPLDTLLDLSRSMADVFSRTLDAMHSLARDVNSTASGLQTLANAQRHQGAPTAHGSLPTGAFYDKLPFMGGNKGGPASRDLMDSKAKQLVEVRVVFTRISEIDTVNQVFDAEVYIQARWRETKFAGYSEAALAHIEFFQCSDPQLKLLNVVGDLDMEKTSMVLRYEPDSISPVLVYMWHVRGTFRERMELQHFPFDVQELSIVISSELPIEGVELTGDFFRASSINIGALEANQDWSNYRHVEVTRDLTTQEMAGTSKHSVLVVAARVKRRLAFYFWNVVVIMLLIKGMTLVFLAVDPTGSTRLSLSVTLFFTAVAFKLVVRNTLPTISYLTYLDLYIIFAMTYLFLWAAVNALMCHLARYRDRQRIMEYDEIAQSSLIGLLVLFHLLFLIYIQVTALSRRREMNRLDMKYQVAKLMRQGHVHRPPLTTTNQESKS